MVIITLLTSGFNAIFIISEDLTVDSSASSSLIHMSVVDSGPGVRRSSVVVIEHVPELQGEDGDQMEEEEEIQTHIFV